MIAAENVLQRRLNIVLGLFPAPFVVRAVNGDLRGRGLLGVALIFVVVGSFVCLFGFRFGSHDGFLSRLGIEDIVFDDIVLIFPQKGLCFRSD